MGALSGGSIWTMEDDFRLRKAAETGVSLESLAKGEVQFSKRFTIQEMQDRWLAILYDPVVSAQASARMRELEHSDSAPILKTDHLGKIEEKVSVSGKRKPESIRKRFYAMRKKMRDHHPLDLVNVGIPNENLNSNGFRNEEHPQNKVAGFLTYGAVNNADVNLDVNQNNRDGIYIEYKDNNISVMENDVQIEESDGFEELYDLLDMPLNERDESLPHLDFNSDIQLGDAELENQMCGENITEVTNTNSYLMELSNNLLDLDIDDDLPLMDADGNVIDKSYIDNWSSVFLDFPNKDGTCDIVVDEFLDSNENQHQSDQQETKSLELFMPPSKPFTSTIICTLNTEDPEIPSNDDVFLLNLDPSTSGGMQMDVFKPPPHPTSKINSGANSRRDFKVPKKIIPKDNKFEKSFITSPIIGSQWRSEILVDHKVKHEFSRSEDRSQVRSAIIPKSNIFPSENTSINPENKTVCNHDMNAITTIPEKETINAEIRSTEVINPILLASHSLINQEPLSYQSDNGNDEDIPSYSDVEAMILDEDSSLDEQHIYLNGIGSSEHLQTFKYENAETQKRIIRLEQAAVASVKKDLTSRGAFAVLQGWHMKFYIKKPEVLIGRATEDFDVDIDLGRESRNSRVSRRQAIIHLDHKGFFHLKNLSKYSIFVNRVELATNQSISLTSSCLIEIKGMAFLFETNEACIKQYVNSIKNKTIMENKS